jgi:hypothetical protein
MVDYIWHSGHLRVLKVWLLSLLACFVLCATTIVVQDEFWCFEASTHRPQQQRPLPQSFDSAPIPSVNWPSNHAVLFVDFAFNVNYVPPAQPNIVLPGITLELIEQPPEAFDNSHHQSEDLRLTLVLCL